MASKASEELKMQNAKIKNGRLIAGIGHVGSTKTLARITVTSRTRSVLECGGPPPLSPARGVHEPAKFFVRAQSARGLAHSQTLARITATPRARTILQCGVTHPILN